MPKRKLNNSRVLCIGDPHEPVCRKGYLEFCQDTAKKYKCDTVVIMGDVVDWTAISFHAYNPEAPGPMDEYRLALAGVQRWRKAFPVRKNGRIKRVIVTIGNHDARPRRVAESVNIPNKFIRNYADIWNTPKWDWIQSIVIDGVFYCHGHRKRGGMHPAFNTAKDMGMSIVLGHHHSVGGVKWLINPLRRWFGLDVGCGIDDKAYAFAYAAEQTKRSCLSCAVVLNGNEPYHIMMPASKGEKYWDGNF